MVVRRAGWVLAVFLCHAVTGRAQQLAASSVPPGMRPVAGTTGGDKTSEAASGGTATVAEPVRPNVRTAVQVRDDQALFDLDAGSGRIMTTQAVERSAGTFSDPLRYVTNFAGVIAASDRRNDFLVRGGNPDESGFVVDNIEMPSISQMALSDTSGGLVSMIDNSAIQQMTLHTDAYDSRYDERLSSILEISTRPDEAVSSRAQLEFGFAGLGGSLTRQIDGTNFFASARQSVVQYTTSDIGLNGTPSYRNALVRADRTLSERDSLWGLSLMGSDSISIHPDPLDPAETNPYDVQYNGWRNTTGINWEHAYTASSRAVLSVAESMQNQTIHEQAQLLSGQMVYDENTGDAWTTAKYDWTFAPTAAWTLRMGGRGAMDALDYTVAQPIGLQNPYSADPQPVDAMSINQHGSVMEAAGYIESAWTLPHSWALMVGARAMHWELTGDYAATGRVQVAHRIRNTLWHIGFANYVQPAPTLYLLSFNNLRTLAPIESRQLTAGTTLFDNEYLRLTLAAYTKDYLHYPVSAEYPQLSMANVVDTFGQAFLMFPMQGTGTGVARGVESTLDLHLSNHLTISSNTTYARSWYAGSDGVLRKANYDLPVVENVTGTWLLRHQMVLAWRYTFTSGWAYTPDNLPLSIAQNRDVYDLTKINAERSNSYQRLDFNLTQTHRMRHGELTWHAGLLNALNHQNFYANQWEPQLTPHTGTASISTQYQLSRFPDGGVRYTF